jgi:alkanesulfonate monooxygenase SsuD/methylene tetrahydromethanopterin reductase-like flavin-dependent oxidoreductase (luciferase family)
VDIGVSLRSGFPVEDARQGARWMVERAVAAREAGLDLLCVGDHHSTGPIAYYQNVVLARLLAEWEGRAGALYLLPLWHPVLVAEQVGTLASLTSGRFVIQCALGAGRAQLGAMGVESQNRVSRFEAALDIIRRLLEGETVSATDPWRIDAARIAPIPAEPVEVWIGATASKAIDRAARLGETWYAGPELTISQATTRLTMYLERCEAHGRTPAPVPIRRDVYIGESDRDVEVKAGPVLAGGYRGIDRGAIVAGTVEQAATHFAELGRAGFGMVVARQLVDDQTAALASTTRLGEVRQLVRDV